MTTHNMEFDPETDKISLHSSSEDENESIELDSDGDEAQYISDPFPADDSDSAPEEVTFKTAQEKTLEAKRKASEIILTDKKEMKRKRKEMHLQNMKQKEEKRKKIELKKLPDSLLKDLDKHPDPAYKDETLEASELKESRNKKEFVDEVTEIHGPTIFKCKVLKNKSKYIPEKALTFKEQFLYDKRVRREKSSREAFLKKEKQRAGGRLNVV